MKRRGHFSYINICIGYRIITLALSTIVYIVMSAYMTRERINWNIVEGMIIACLLSSWLYRRIQFQGAWLRIMFSIEVAAYGIFIFLSGGLSSPYLWYQMSFILLMIALEDYIWMPLVASLWVVVCALAGRVEKGMLTYQELNLFLGMLTVISGFFVIRFYVNGIERQKKLLAALNVNLEEEKRRREDAFIRLAGMYETFDLLAMSDPEKIMRELTGLLRRFTAPEGCILIKLDNKGLPEIRENCGIEEQLAGELERELDLEGGISEEDFEEGSRMLYAGGDKYEAKMIGELAYFQGVLIRRRGGKEHENEEIYWKLAETVFNNLDTHVQMERFITTEEQNRIANEIHDTVIQKLFGVTCSLKVFENGMEAMEPEKRREYVLELKRSVELTMSELRESIYGRVFDQTENTLTGAIKSYMEDMEALCGAAITLDLDESADRLIAAQKIAVYRIACEAVNNAIRHGRATLIDVKLTLEPESVNLSVEDNGLGFNRKEKAFGEGNGLRNMRNMTVLLKGGLSIETRESRGTRIQLSLPR